MNSVEAFEDLFQNYSDMSLFRLIFEKTPDDIYLDQQQFFVYEEKEYDFLNLAKKYQFIVYNVIVCKSQYKIIEVKYLSKHRELIQFLNL